MSRGGTVDEEASDDWWTLISLTRPRDAYPHFLANKRRIEALLRAGHSMYRVWDAYRKGSLPFPASYETFRTYCVKHGLSGLRRAALSPDAAGEGAPGLGGIGHGGVCEPWRGVGDARSGRVESVGVGCETRGARREARVSCVETETAVLARRINPESRDAPSAGAQGPAAHH